MKRNISDLLDDTLIDDIEMNIATPLSSKRIRKKTLDQIGGTKTVRISWGIRLAAVIALIAAMMLTAFAADMVVNDGAVFHSLFGDNLSENQVTLLGDIGKSYEQSDERTCNGATITPINAYSDGETYYLHIRVQAPEGVVLPDVSMEEGSYYTFDDGSYPGTSVYGETVGGEWSHSVEYYIQVLADEDPTDNVKEMAVRFDSPYLLTGVSNPKLNIRGLYMVNIEDGVREKLFTGSFCFDVGLSLMQMEEDDRKLEIDTGNLSFYNEEYHYTTTIKKMTILPFTVIVDHSSTEPDNRYIFPRGGPIEIILKDGTVACTLEPYYDASAHKYPHPDSIIGVTNEFRLDNPLVIKDIDYIRINGEHIIDVN